MQDIMGSRIDYICDVISTSLPLVRAKSVKALALLSPTRSPVMPELPTADEQGLKDFDGDGWNAFFFPDGTPEPIVRRLATTTSVILDDKAVHDRLQGLGLNVPVRERRTPEYLAKLVRSELDKWRAPIKASGAAEQ
jgi:tripartite-type tricarboxylate transporter receptor subunit TctC